jgi:hypothetical protein
MASQDYLVRDSAGLDGVLGDCRAEFRAHRWIVFAGFALSILCGVLAALCLAAALFMQGRPRADLRLEFGSRAAMGALFLVGAAFLFRQVSRLNGMIVSLHTGGIAVRRGENLSVVPWDEIQNVWRSEKAFTAGPEDLIATLAGGFQSVYTLETREGERLVFNSHLRGLQTLGEAIRRETTQRLLPRMQKDYQIEGKVEFNKLTVGPDGLSKGGRTLPWNEVGSVLVENGYVVVRKPDGRRAWRLGVQLDKVPNVDGFLALVESILKTR